MEVVLILFPQNAIILPSMYLLLALSVAQFSGLEDLVAHELETVDASWDTRSLGKPVNTIVLAFTCKVHKISVH